jgi:hypothetical protein
MKNAVISEPPTPPGVRTEVRANDGSYVFSVPVCAYTVKAEKQGFQTTDSFISPSLLASFLNFAGLDLLVIIIFLLTVAVVWRLLRR